eukprot:SAG11_NODE_2210_length_3683_cov_5.278181_3_plen_81_part_00
MPQNWFTILSEECLFHIFNGCSAQSVGRLSVCCQDFNTLLKDRVEQSKTIMKVEKKTGKPFSEAVAVVSAGQSTNIIFEW